MTWSVCFQRELLQASTRHWCQSWRSSFTSGITSTWWICWVPVPNPMVNIPGQHVCLLPEISARPLCPFCWPHVWPQGLWGCYRHVCEHLGQVPQLSGAAHNMSWDKFWPSQALTSSPDLWCLLTRSSHGYCWVLQVWKPLQLSADQAGRIQSLQGK